MTINKLVIYKAQSYLNVRELKNDNRSIEIDKFHKYYGLPYGNPWCMMFVGYSYYEAFLQHNMKSPIPKIARVSTFSQYALKRPLEFKVISSKKILLNTDKLVEGDIISFKHGKLSNVDNFDWNGHVALGIKQTNKTFLTIEGNTKYGNVGDQTGRTIGNLSGGLDGVYMRERTISLNSNFPIVYIIRLNNLTSK